MKAPASDNHDMVQIYAEAHHFGRQPLGIGRVASGSRVHSRNTSELLGVTGYNPIVHRDYSGPSLVEIVEPMVTGDVREDECETISDMYDGSAL